MKIVIHGTKDGYHTFTPESKKFFDVGSDSPKSSAIGQFAYSIQFNTDDVIFTKYKIIRDVAGDKRTGNIGFSLILSKNQKLSGFYVKELLGIVCNEYSSKYIQNNNLENIKEDWSFLNAVQEKYKEKIIQNFSSRKDSIVAGNSEAAFIYYPSVEELHNYFEHPFQEEYYKFKQVFFVNKDLKSTSESPLNALRHDPDKDLTNKIDLENPKFTLKEFHGNGKGGVNIELWANDRRISNGDSLYKKDTVRIKISKRYCDTIDKTGKLFDSDIAKYFSIEDNRIRVKFEYELVKVNKTFPIEVKDPKGQLVNDAKIVCKSQNSTKHIPINNQVTFEGEELKERWLISAKSGDSLISDEISITPENSSGSIVLKLEEQKEVQFKIQDIDGNVIYGFQIYIENKSLKNDEDKVVFKGYEIKQIWNVKVSHRDYNIENFQYCPADGRNPCLVKLTRGQKGENQKTYNVDAGDHGRLKGNNPHTSNSSSGSDVKHVIEPNKGYKFKYFKEKGNKLIAQYEKLPPFYTKPKFIAGLAASVFAILILIFGLYYFLKDEPPTPTVDLTEIEKYTEGIELKKVTLDEYKKNYCIDESNQTYRPADICEKLEYAIKLREKFVNVGEIDSLEIALYSSAQNYFKEVVSSIDSVDKSLVSKSLNNYKVSVLDLDQVADFIEQIKFINSLNETTTDLTAYEDSLNNIQNYFPDKSESYKTKETDIEKRLKEIQELIASKKIEPAKSDAQPPKYDTSMPKSDSKEVTPDKIVVQPKPPSNTNSNSNLDTEFWDLVKKTTDPKKEDYDKLLEKYKKSGGEKIDFLKLICANSESFKKYKDIAYIERIKSKTIQDLKDKMNN